jgi:hypothetical protein
MRFGWLVVSLGLVAACSGSGFTIVDDDSQDGGGGNDSGGGGGDSGSNPDAPGPALDACGPFDTCTPLPVGCCTPCGDVEASMFFAVNAKNVSKASERCAGTGCPACIGFDYGNIGARCVSGKCQVFDVRKEKELSGCTDLSECTLRHGVRCCEGCSSNELVSVSLKGETILPTQVCPADGSRPPCPECAPQPDPNAKAACVQGTCRVVRAR